MIPVVVVAGGADGGTRSTVALNLAVALSSLGHRVRLVDRDPTAPLARALVAGGAAAPPQSVVLEAGAGLGLTVRLDDDAPASIRVVDAGPILDGASLDVVRRAELVVVPLDASDSAQGALQLVAAAFGGETDRLRLVLSRLLPRDADRWRLVDDLDDRFAGALSPVTLPMGRREGARQKGTKQATVATLFAPTGKAARAYRAVARELAARVGLAPGRESV